MKNDTSAEREMSDYDFAAWCLDAGTADVRLVSALDEWVRDELTPADRTRFWGEHGQKMREALAYMEQSTKALQMLIDELEPVN